MTGLQLKTSHGQFTASVVSRSASLESLNPTSSGSTAVIRVSFVLRIDTQALVGGVSDTCTLLMQDADNDGHPNFLDLDSDGDGISDDIELVADMDEDGVPNYLGH